MAGLLRVGSAVVAALAVVSCGGDDFATSAPGAASGPTYHTDVAPILRESCQGCHVEGGIAPFALRTYEDAASMASLIAKATRSREMPPFGAQDTPECKPAHPWRDDLRLEEATIETLEAWYAAGAPEGTPDSSDEPPPPNAYELPNAQLELAPAAPYSPPVGEGDVFRCFVLDPKLDSTAFLNGIQVVPGNEAIVHHVTIYTDPASESPALADADGGYECFGGAEVTGGNLIDAWAPGGPPREFPPDVGAPIPAGSKLVMQIHYHPTPLSADPDLTRVELRFVPEPSYQLLTVILGNYGSPVVEQEHGTGELLPGPNDAGGVEFLIPANVAGHTESMRFTLDVGDGGAVPDIFIYGVANHMHYVGKDMRLGLRHTADGADECLLQTPAWDFSWQRFYAYDRPIQELSRVQPGDVFSFACEYDNTLDNPYVARALKEEGLTHPKEIHLGEATLDEMCIGALQVVVPIGAM